MLKKARFAAAVAPALMLAGHVAAGGVLSLQLGNPEASEEARKANAVLTVRSAGCHTPGKTEVTATAIGTVDGRRQRIPLKLIRLPEPDTFALARQWPQNGKWVVELVGKEGSLFTNTLVRVVPGGMDRHNARSDFRPFSEGDIEAMLDTR